MLEISCCISGNVTDKNSRTNTTTTCSLTLEISRISHIIKTLYKCNDVIFDVATRSIALTGQKSNVKLETKLNNILITGHFSLCRMALPLLPFLFLYLISTQREDKHTYAYANKCTLALPLPLEI